MSRSVAIVQSSYIPWKGYFDLMRRVDEFILLDDVQFTRRDWRNRNIVKGKGGPRWLTIPVSSSGNYNTPTKEIRICDSKWNVRHLRTFLHEYAKANCFKTQKDWLESLYLTATSPLLSEVNLHFTRAIALYLGLTTKVSWSMDHTFRDGKTERLVDLCRAVGGTVYISGPSARNYMDEQQFKEAGIQLFYFNYSGYKEYPQIFPPFDHRVTILDLILSVGTDAIDLLDGAVGPVPADEWASGGTSE